MLSEEVKDGPAVERRRVHDLGGEDEERGFRARHREVVPEGHAAKGDELGILSNRPEGQVPSEQVHHLCGGQEGHEEGAGALGVEEAVSS